MLFASAAAKRLLLMSAVVVLVLPQLAGAASTTVTARVCHAVMAATTLATLTPNPTITTVASLTGTTEPNAAVSIASGSATIATVLADGSGHYAVSAAIVVGDNHLKATGTDACGHQSTSAEVLIIRNAVPPPMPLIHEPLGGTTTTQPTIMLSGLTEPSATVTLARGSAVVATLTADNGGNFSTSLPLEIGQNSFTATAENAAGPGPVSQAVAVTRLPPPPAAAPAASPPASGPAASATPRLSSAALAVPLIISPNGSVLSANTWVMMTVLGQAGTTLEIYRAGELLYSLVVGTDGPVSVQAAQRVGENVWTVRARRGSEVSGFSPAVTTIRQPATPATPLVTEPAGDVTVHQAAAWFGGTADAGTTLNIYAGRRVIATMVVGEGGVYRVRVPLQAGANALYAEAVNGEMVRRSSLRIITYEPPSPAALTKLNLQVAGTAVAGTVLGAAVVAAQAIGDVVGTIVASPPATTAVLSASLVAPVGVRGLVGVEFLFTLMAIITGWGWGLVAGPKRRRIMVTDSLTGQPIGLTKAFIHGRRASVALSNKKGELWLKEGTKAHQITYTRPGYVALPSSDDHNIRMEPVPAATTLARSLLDACAGTLAWGLIILGAFSAVVLAATQPNAFTLGSAALFVGLLGMNTWLLIAQPRYHWGHIRDSATGRMLAGVELQLRSQATGKLSHYTTRPDGRYTLWAEPGTYELTVWAHGYGPYHETITIRHKATYFGFKVALHQTPSL